MWVLRARGNRFPYQGNRCALTRALIKLHDLALIQVSRSDCSALALIQVLSLIALALIQSSAYDCSRLLSL